MTNIRGYFAPVIKDNRDSITAQVRNGLIDGSLTNEERANIRLLRSQTGDAVDAATSDGIFTKKERQSIRYDQRLTMDTIDAYINNDSQRPIPFPGGVYYSC